MSRDEIIATLPSHGAVALIHMIEDVEAGRLRPGAPARPSGRVEDRAPAADA